MKNKTLLPLEEETVARMYTYAQNYLPQNKFFHYEVSNFSKPGYECKHNFHYWDNDPYLGLGPSAVSYFNGIRQRNALSVQEYIQRLQQKKSPVIFSEKLSRKKSAQETAAVKIRTSSGIDFAHFKEKTGFDFLVLEANALKELIKEGLVGFKTKNNENNGICLTKKGFLFCDSVSAAFL
jgi:oxygen-independent coproporphyrinogen-3 oxidase